MLTFDLQKWREFCQVSSLYTVSASQFQYKYTW